MPSKDIEASRSRDLDQPGLSPNQVTAINQFYDGLTKDEAGRALAMVQKDRAELDANLKEHEDKFKAEFLPSITERLRAGKRRTRSTKDLASDLEEVEGAIAYVEGLLTSYRSRYAKLDEIEEDPNAYMDSFYRKWQTLAETRFQSRPSRTS